MSISYRLPGRLIIVALATFIPLNSFYFRDDYCTHQDVSAISFDLTPDYGTAAVHLPDGSSVAVAKIEGNTAYKAFMRRQEDVSLLSRSSYLDRVGETFAVLGIYLPSWNTLGNTRRADKTAVQQLLQILKSAAESYLGHAICFINFSLPEGSTTSEYKQSIVGDAVYQIGLGQVVDVTYYAGICRMIRDTALYMEDTQTLILTIDNSRYGFNLGVYFNDEGVIETVRHKYQHLDEAADVAERPNLLKQALEEIIKPPFGSHSIVGSFHTLSKNLSYTVMISGVLTFMIRSNLPLTQISSPMHGGINQFTQPPLA